MPPPQSLKQLKSLVGQVSYLRRFIPALAKVTHAFGALMKERSEFRWSEKHQQVLNRLRGLLSSPTTMVAPRIGIPLRLYITSTERSIGALLAQEKDGQERPVYYISRVVQGVEARYSPIERHCLFLAFAAKKFRHYFLAHTIHLITKCDSLRYLLSRPIISGRVARWLLALAEFDIQCLAPRVILSQAMVDLIAQFPSRNFEPVHDDLPLDEFDSICCADENMIWTLSFDESSTSTGGGARVVLTPETGQAQNLSYKLTFGCSNNTVEYEALVLGFLAAREAKIKRLHEPALAAYRTIIQKLSGYFSELQKTHAPRTANRHPDALATLASKVEITGESVDICIHRKNESCLYNVQFANSEDKDWRDPYKSQLKGGVGDIPLVELKNFTVYLGVLYFRAPGGTLARCVGRKEASKVLGEIHGHTCELFEGNQDVANVEEDWRRKYVEYLENRSLLKEPGEAALLRREASRFFICSDELMRQGFDGKAKRCVNLAEAREVLKQAHNDEHQG
ncbi:uncharacterized protein LOC132316511 [Cornus florida]|uniref:uncharacterized protein LOC132316511 n=1 Tax=Cornus florida TaxID=4283 RepID=UPI002896DCD6|nr:uncharacterized protein LOC132316511 [Cornus florida]